MSFSNFRTDETFTSDDDCSEDDNGDEYHKENDVKNADPTASMLEFNSSKGLNDLYQHVLLDPAFGFRVCVFRLSNVENWICY